LIIDLKFFKIWTQFITLYMILKLEYIKVVLENNTNNLSLYIKLIEKCILNRINPNIYKLIFSKTYK